MIGGNQSVPDKKRKKFGKKSDAEEEMVGFTKMNFVETQEKKV